MKKSTKKKKRGKNGEKNGGWFKGLMKPAKPKAAKPGDAPEIVTGTGAKTTKAVQRFDMKQVAVLPEKEHAKTHALQTINSVDDLIALALREKSSMEQIDKFMQMKYRHEEREAKKEFFLAMSRFQAEVGSMLKKGNVNFKNKVGTTTDYDYAPLGQIEKQIKEPMANNLLSKSFEIDDTNRIKVTCIVTHANGHSESTSMTADADASGGKNTIQSRGSTVTYLSRYTLLARLGLVTADQDNDGQTADDKEPPKGNAPPPKKTHNTKPSEVLPPEKKPEPSRQAQDLLLQVTWKNMRKFNPDKFTAKFYADSLEFIAPGVKITKDLTGPQITALIGELEAQLKAEKEANNG